MKFDVEIDHTKIMMNDVFFKVWDNYLSVSNNKTDYIVIDAFLQHLDKCTLPYHYIYLENNKHKMKYDINLDPWNEKDLI